MFDREHRHFHSSPVNVHIKQQPNDAADAARLYGELEAKATQAVATATIETMGANNAVKFLKIDSYREPFTEVLKVRLLFSVNGQVFDLITENTLFDIREAVYGSIIGKLFEQCTKQLINLDRTGGVGM